jgi:hypothetical protein
MDYNRLKGYTILFHNSKYHCDMNKIHQKFKVPYILMYQLFEFYYDIGIELSQLSQNQ